MTNSNSRPKLEDKLVTSLPIQGTTTTKVTLTTTGSAGIAKDAETGAYRGLISKDIAKSLQELKTRCNVTITAAIKAPNELSIVVYGLGAESETVGDILVQYNLYLQLPYSFDVSVPYQNPQSFSLPISGNTAALDMPVREAKGSSVTAMALLDSVAKSKVNDLLDSATGPEQFREVQASAKLLTELKPSVPSCSLS